MSTTFRPRGHRCGGALDCDMCVNMASARARDILIAAGMPGEFLYGDIRAPELAAALARVQGFGGTTGRRVRELRALCMAAGDIGVVSWD